MMSELYLCDGFSESLGLVSHQVWIIVVLFMTLREISVLYRDRLSIDPKEHPMLLAEPSFNTQQYREK
jgi:hypothetical protein